MKPSSLSKNSLHKYNPHHLMQCQSMLSGTRVMQIEVNDKVGLLSILNPNLLAMGSALTPEHGTLFRQSDPRSFPCLTFPNERPGELIRLDISCRCACGVCTSFPTRTRSDTTQRANTIQTEVESNLKGFRISRHQHLKFRFFPATDQPLQTRIDSRQVNLPIFSSCESRT